MQLIRVLITGAGGQLGRAFARGWPSSHQILAHPSGALDICDSERVRQLLDSYQPHLVINCAAFTNVDAAQSDPDLAFRVNADAPEFLARELAQRGAALIHFSSDFVFDGSSPDPYRESDPANPLSVYGASKLQGDIAIGRANGPSLVFRTSWLYSFEGDNFFQAVMRQFRSEDTLRVVDDQIGAPTYVAELTDAIRGYVLGDTGDVTPATMLSRVRADRGLYNLCALGHVTRAGLAQAILERAAASDRHGADVRCRRIVPVSSADYGASVRRPANSRLDCERARSNLNLVLGPWQSGLDRCMVAFEGTRLMCDSAA